MRHTTAVGQLWHATLGLVIWTLSAAAFAQTPANPQSALAGAAQETTFSVDDFERSIRPLLVARCIECHEGSMADGDLQVTSREQLVKSGDDSGAIVPGEPGASSFLARLRSDDEDERMPPDESLSDEEIAAVEAWIQHGAIWPKGDGERWYETNDASDAPHWAFQEIADVTPPTVGDTEVRTPIDQFIAARLRTAGIIPVGGADRATLIRRATLDLTGLPPTTEETAAFLADPAENAYEQLIERLLGSSDYGRRWGRHWLDLARYADTSGDGTDMPIPEARYYRDYVIDAFNQDLPYNRFLVEQIAGDKLAEMNPDSPRSHEWTIATGFVALARRYGNSKFANSELIVDDSIDTLGRSVMALSLGCARCHHHKFDPVSTEDYYGLAGYFRSTQYPHAGTEHQKERSDLVPFTPPEEQGGRYESPVAWAVTDKKEGVGDTQILIGGEPKRKGSKTPRGYLAFIAGNQMPTIPDGDSGRLQLALWLASPDHPLTARVMVNRVWQHHFGRGFVPNASNFGIQSPAPTHPDLMDWMATEFVENKWSIKHLHRVIMLSATYMRSSEDNSDAREIDEGNELFWRQNRRRMDAEQFRDSLLAASGDLEQDDGGRHPFKPTEKLNYTQGRPFTETFDHHRRSVYLMSARLNRHPMMALFDGPDANVSTAKRNESTVALQSLFLMNGSFLSEQADSLARRVRSETVDRDERIEYVWLLLYSRQAAIDDRRDVASFLVELQENLTDQGMSSEQANGQAWAALSRVLLSSNAFIYID